MENEHGAVTVPDGVYIDDRGLWWRARLGATSTFEENIAARAQFSDLHHNEFWNPWRVEEHAADLERAEQIMSEWERAEPGFKRKTNRQVEAEMARWERDFERKRAQREQCRQENLKRYDPEREANRLALLECQCIVAHTNEELAKIRSGEAFPAMDSKRRSDRVIKLEAEAARYQEARERLVPLVGDPEDVVDQHGLLPSDRRHSSLYHFQERRIAEVRELRAKLPELETRIKTTEDSTERSKLRAERDCAKYRLKKWLAVPRLNAKAMCADCATPWDRHGYVTPPFDYPCPAWPGQRAVRAKVLKMLETSAQRGNDSAPPEPVPPKPRPLAVVPSGLPITEIVQRLQELQEQYPDAEVRRGRSNRWELWPKPESSRG